MKGNASWVIDVPLRYVCVWQASVCFCLVLMVCGGGQLGAAAPGRRCSVQAVQYINSFLCLLVLM